MIHIEAIEDAAQSALMTALETWPIAGQPDNPSAWLFRVAHNGLMGELRKRTGHQRVLGQAANEAELIAQPHCEVFLPGDIQDDLLRMLFVCCDDGIPLESQVALALKTLCGFGVHEIAERLFTSETNIYKRIRRARKRLSELAQPLPEPDSAQMVQRLPAVHTVLYTLFTEGHLLSHSDFTIRRELCTEATRLGNVLAHSAMGQSPETAALMALMHLHGARIPARQAPGGGLLLLEEQDRSLFCQHQIHLGLAWLARSANGESYSRYHAEAATLKRGRNRRPG